jgi:hypothetical protein
MSKVLAFALAAAVSLSGVTIGFAKSQHHHHRAGMTSSDVKNRDVKSINKLPGRVPIAARVAV